MKEKDMQVFKIGSQSIVLYVPAISQKEGDEQPHLLYWRKVWPAAIALSTFIQHHAEYVQNKTVLELAAGLGLPSLTAAHKAKKVWCTDYAPQAVQWAQASAAPNGFTNIDYAVMDWRKLSDALYADTVLVSDMTYNPDDFDTLHSVLQKLLQKGSTVLISTPQRLMAKTFIERILPWCVHQAEIPIPHQGTTVYISVFVLRAVV